MTGALGDLELEDSPGPEVQALLDGGALWDGLGCGGEVRMGPTLVWYLFGTGAAAATGAGTVATTAAGAVMAAVAAATGVAAAAVATGAAAAIAGPGLELPAGGGEDCLTLGLKPGWRRRGGGEDGRKKGFRNELE